MSHSSSQRSPRLLATDMDGTFLGDTDAMHTLWARLESEDIGLLFATGRHLASIEAFYEAEKLDRRTRFCVCMVGTAIYERKGSGYVLDSRWCDSIARGWDRDAVDAVARAVDGVVLQDAVWQSPLKCSYYVEREAPAVMTQIQRRLDRAGQPARIIYSSNRFLDVIPAGAGKGLALAYLADRLGVDRRDVVTAGDSGNDEDMMQAELGFRSIIVGNAEAKLLALCGQHIYHARAPYAAGIIEGLRRWGWL